MEENGELGERLLSLSGGQNGGDAGVFQGEINEFERGLV
jgi:hypothetical protein